MRQEKISSEFFNMGEVHQNLEDEKNSSEFFNMGEVYQNLEDEKNSSEFFNMGEVHQNLEDEKNPSEFFNMGEVHQNLEDEKNPSEFFELLLRAALLKSAKSKTCGLEKNRFFSCRKSEDLRHSPLSGLMTFEILLFRVG